MKIVLITSMALSMPAVAMALGKVDTVRNVIKTSCGHEIQSDEALRLVRDLYLTCIPKSKIEIEHGCEVTCLKENEGSVVGQ